MPVVTYKKTKLLGDSLEDFIITVTDWNSKPKRLISFCIIQLYSPGEVNYEVIKFDTAHGKCHVHRYYQRLNHEGEDINRDISPATFNEFRAAIKENWRKYKRLYIKKWGSKP